MTRPIRVLELRSVAGTGGGPDKTILASAQGHNPRIALTVCYLCNAGDEVFRIGEQARALGIDYVELRERGLVDRAVWRGLRDLVRSRGIDIVHGHDYKTDLFAWLLGRAERVIPLSTAHGWTGHSWRERLLYYPGHRRLLARFPRVIAVSGEIKQALTRAGARPERIDVVLNGIDPTRFRRDPAAVEEARAHYGVRPGEVCIGAVGRLEPQKRFDLLIGAFDQLRRESRRPLRLLIAGEGSARGALEARIAALGVGEACRLVGQADVIRFHHALDVFVQSSDYEGTPNVVLEAMAMDTPIVATDAGGTAELISHDVHGLVIPRGDAAVLRDAIARVLADAATAAGRARAARQRVETDLSFARRMAKIDAICERVFAEHHRVASGNG